MQFGPTSAIPCWRAMSATSACIAAAASPPSTTPPPGMIDGRDAGGGRRLGDDGGTQRVERDERDVRAAPGSASSDG